MGYVRTSEETCKPDVSEIMVRMYQLKVRHQEVEVEFLYFGVEGGK